MWIGGFETRGWFAIYPLQEPVFKSPNHQSNNGIFLPPFVRKLATPSKRNPSLRGGRSCFHKRRQKDPPAIQRNTCLCDTAVNTAARKPASESHYLVDPWLMQCKKLSSAQTCEPRRLLKSACAKTLFTTYSMCACVCVWFADWFHLFSRCPISKCPGLHAQTQVTGPLQHEEAAVGQRPAPVDGLSGSNPSAQSRCRFQAHGNEGKQMQTLTRLRYARLVFSKTWDLSQVWMN